MRANLSPSVWGRDSWSFLKKCAHAVDEESLPHYQALMSLLPHVLPCEQCRHHAKEYIAQHPLTSTDVLGWLDAFEQSVTRRKQRDRELEHAEWGLLGDGPGVLLVVFALCCLLALLCLSQRLVGLRRG